jgi:hypothetical protein
LFTTAGVGHAVRDKLLHTHILGDDPAHQRRVLRYSAILRVDITTAEEAGVSVSVSDILALWREPYRCLHHTRLWRHSKVYIIFLSKRLHFNLNVISCMYKLYYLTFQACKISKIKKN